MKIEQVRVQNYKSILDSGWVDIEDDITTLVGANEAGKTNFLEALSRFKDGEEIKDKQLSRYNNINSREKSKIPIVTLIVSETPSHLFKSIKNTLYIKNEFKGMSDVQIKVRRYADGAIVISKQTINNYLSNEQIGKERDDYTSYLKNTITEYGYDLPITDGAGQVSFPIDSDEIDSSIDEINEKIAEISVPNVTNVSEIFTMRSTLRFLSWSKKSRELALDELDTFPDFLFFKDIEPIAERIPRSELQSQNPYSKLLDAVNMDSESLNELSTHEVHRRNDEANEQITEQFNNNWKQAEVKFGLRFTNDNVTLRIYEEADDGEEEIRTLPSDRSQGFRWFLSFFCHLLASDDGEITNSVILLDDPGAYLHPEGHKDLLDALNELADANQILYNTHSPYMIDKNRLSRVRTVRHLRDPEEKDGEQSGDAEEDEEINEAESKNEDERIGTVVTRLSEVDSHADDSLKPIRMALGATFGDSLFASKRTLLVEGADDRIYLERMSELLGDEEPLLDDVNIVDCGGASKTHYFARIVDSENYNAAVLFDDDTEGQRERDELVERAKEDDLDVEVFHTGEYADVDDYTTIEDMFSGDLLCEVAADIHDEISESEFQSRINPDHGEIAKDLNGRLKAEVEVEDPPKWVLDKKEIARNIDNRAARKGEDLFKSETLNRFEELLGNINDSLTPTENNEAETTTEEATADD